MPQTGVILLPALFIVAEQEVRHGAVPSRLGVIPAALDRSLIFIESLHRPVQCQQDIAQIIVSIGIPGLAGQQFAVDHKSVVVSLFILLQDAKVLVWIEIAGLAADGLPITHARTGPLPFRLLQNAQVIECPHVCRLQLQCTFVCVSGLIELPLHIADHRQMETSFHVIGPVQ